MGCKSRVKAAFILENDMGKILFFILLPALNLYALRIHSVTVSPVSAAQLSIGLNTEAEELYYFHSWRYTVSGDSILMEICFVPGFGSQVSPLNNTFAVPLEMTLPTIYRLTVRVYYTDLNTFYQPPDLQDEQTGQFFTPLAQAITLSGHLPEKKNLEVFPNPTDDLIYIPGAYTEISVFDRYGRKMGSYANTGIISLGHLADGFYVLLLNTHQNVKIILKKQ